MKEYIQVDELKAAVYEYRKQMYFQKALLDKLHRLRDEIAQVEEQVHKHQELVSQAYSTLSILIDG